MTGVYGIFGAGMSDESGATVFRLWIAVPAPAVRTGSVAASDLCC